MRNRFLCKGKHAGEPFGSILPTTDVAHEHARTRCPHAWEGDVHISQNRFLFAFPEDFKHGHEKICRPRVMEDVLMEDSSNT